MTEDGRIPITVLGGWLGSGKTTLLNRVLRTAGAERVAVIVNDVGEIAIDASLVAAHEGDTIELTNGCVCCSIGGSLAVTLRDLVLGDLPPDRIVVEASGIAEPGIVASYGAARRLHRRGTFVTVDCTDVRQRARDPQLGSLVRRQLDQADVALLTKVDLVGASDAEAVSAWIDRVAPGTPVELADPDLVLAGVTETTLTAVPASTSVAVATASWVPPGPVAPAAVAAVLEASGLLRAKGVVEGMEGRVLVQLASGRVQVSVAPPTTELGIVLIAANAFALTAGVAELARLAD